MNFIGTLLESMERGSAGSEETARRVLSLCGKLSPEKALFVGDDCFTPKLIQEQTGAEVDAAFSDARHAEKAAALGLNSRVVQLFELPVTEGGYGLVWYNGTVEFDGVAERLEQLKRCVGKGQTAVYRTLCWLIDPSPDTAAYCRRRFGIIEPLDRVILDAKSAGFRLCDFYIAPKTDWTENYYKPLNRAAAEYQGLYSEDGEIAAGMSELKKETDMFELHCEEYSYVYYIMKG